MSCQICTEDFNKSTNSIVTCCHCNENACKSCIRTYILGLSDNASCMFCKGNLDTIFLTSNLNKTWVHTVYKKHTEKVLVDKQIAQLPDTQDLAVRTKEIKLIRKHNDELVKERQKLKEAIKTINENIRDNDYKVNDLRFGTESKEKKTFIYKCPGASCMGFVNSKWECEICENKVCKECMEIITEEHECDPEKVETIKFIKKDTKPCPGCGEMIHKIHGCDQMWCPGCKVAFSWRLGQIEKGNIHNPEYYRWMRENNAELPTVRNDNACGQLPDLRFMLHSLRKIWGPCDNPANRYSVDDPNTIILTNIHRLINHINACDRIFVNDTNNYENLLQDLRVKYLLNEIEKDKWMIKLQALDKAHKKSQDVINIWRFLRDVTLPMLWYICEQFHTDKNITNIRIDIEDNILSKLPKLRLLVNESFERIGRLYGSEYEIITLQWTNMARSVYKRITGNMQ